MSQEQDLLFCKIAISTGKVAQEVAQKCLALANRFEAEGKRRPQVGAIFLKQNLLSTEDVQKIYGAVQKRLEAQGAPVAQATAVSQRSATAKAAGKAAPAAGQRPQSKKQPAAPARPSTAKAVRPTHKATGEKIDKTTLWIGIATGVVFIAVIVTILVILLLGRKAEEPEFQGGIRPAPNKIQGPVVPPAAIPPAGGGKAEKADAQAAAKAALAPPAAKAPEASAEKKDAAAPAPAAGKKEPEKKAEEKQGVE
jgi:hypothetical protein